MTESKPVDAAKLARALQEIVKKSSSPMKDESAIAKSERLVDIYECATKALEAEGLPTAGEFDVTLFVS